jgi:hypothetical protein
MTIFADAGVDLMCRPFRAAEIGWAGNPGCGGLVGLAALGPGLSYRAHSRRGNWFSDGEINTQTNLLLSGKMKCGRIAVGEMTMAITKEDLRDFNRFADERLHRGEAESLVDLAGQWEAQRREMEQTAADIRQSHADIDAGRVASVADTFSEVRKQLGLG